MLTLEHIDPRNSDYICGLENEFNEVIAESTYNNRKNNRFVPYRVCDHPAPVTFGDVGEFLINGEWVVCEFGGETWKEESNRIGCSFTKAVPTPEVLKKGGQAQGKINVENGHLAKAREEAFKATRKKVKMTHISTNKSYYFPSQREAARSLGLDQSKISRCCSNPKFTTKGYRAEFV
jgi:hypothetical protein